MSPSFAESLAKWGPDVHRQPPTRAEAIEYCRKLAATHYENFTVVSRLLPKELRDHFCTIYSFCRWADDLADETSDPEQSERLLDWWASQVSDCYALDHVRLLYHPVFVALKETIAQFEIPAQPFHDLISAFRQ